MKNIKALLIILVSALAFLSSCEKVLMEKELSDNAENNFKVLSEIIDEKYSYLELKNINWDSIVSVNKGKISNKMNVLDEFKVYDEMLYALKDGHVNINSGFDVSRNWEWFLGSPSNFNWNIIERNYLKDDYFISGGLKHRVLQLENDDSPAYGYVYYGSFSSSMTYIDFVKAYLNEFKAKGIIIDVRNNGGGYLKNAKKLADHFADKKRLGYLEYYKVGPGHDEFSQRVEHYIEPKGETWNKPIVVLTNRKCYSATSFFVTMMKELPNVTVLGDKTGGGAGLPIDFTLPNGWYLRFSSTRAKNAENIDFELGVEPHEYLNLDENDEINGEDTLIERAKEIIDSF
ncbi:MAG: peptidase S41 [Bacteroidetes bacterium 4572_77]|nr:MAG: peptidase S41 [Bacteroidetes bacterium 4572_77]